MKTTLNMKLTAIAITCGLTAAPALAQTSGSAPAPAPTATTSAATTEATRLSGSFSNWAGSPENSAALVNGLRTGQPITLTSTPTGTSGGLATTTTFTPPTKPMGYGNVRIALALAQQQLASQGITQPTPQQLQTALMGGPLTTTGPTGVQTTDMQGVLQMRASGMGWGKIANTLGYKLGAVMSGKAAAVPASTTSSATALHGKAGSGITTAAGGAGGASALHGKAGSGIVTASGGTGRGITTGMGSAHTHGGAGSGSGIVSAGGGNGGQAHGGGQGKSGK